MFGRVAFLFSFLLLLLDQHQKCPSATWGTGVNPPRNQIDREHHHPTQNEWDTTEEIDGRRIHYSYDSLSLAHYVVE
jgi:hypothetical protein